MDKVFDATAYVIWLCDLVTVHVSYECRLLEQRNRRRTLEKAPNSPCSYRFNVSLSRFSSLVSSSRKRSEGCCVNKLVSNSRSILIVSLPRLQDNVTYTVKPVRAPVGGLPRSINTHSMVCPCAL